MSAIKCDSYEVRSFRTKDDFFEIRNESWNTEIKLSLAPHAIDDIVYFKYDRIDCLIELLQEMKKEIFKNAQEIDVELKPIKDGDI